MKIENILKHEASNESSIILFKEGIFYRAYERSAMRFTEYIADFKVFKKFFKVVNSEVCYLGFPMKNLPILMQRHGLTKYTETDYYCVIFDCPSQKDFDQWKASIELPTADDYKPVVLLRERVKPKDMNHLLIYKTGYDVMLELHRMVAQLPREHKFTVGDRIKNEALELSLAAYQIGLNKKIAENKLVVGERIEIIRLLLRMLRDLKCLSLHYFSEINTKLETLYIEVEK